MRCNGRRQIRPHRSSRNCKASFSETFHPLKSMNQKLKVIAPTIAVTIALCGCCLFASSGYDTRKFQAIHQAAMNGDTNRLDEILRTNAALVNVADYDKNTPLHLAAMRGHPEAVKLLLEKGANVNFQNAAGMTAL